jgi:hypothetical protein
MEGWRCYPFTELNHTIFNSRHPHPCYPLNPQAQSATDSGGSPWPSHGTMITLSMRSRTIIRKWTRLLFQTRCSTGDMDFHHTQSITARLRCQAFYLLSYQHLTHSLNPGLDASSEPLASNSVRLVNAFTSGDGVTGDGVLMVLENGKNFPHGLPSPRKISRFCALTCSVRTL